MSISDWKYYNHAAVPTTAPHEKPDLTPLKDGSIWNIDGKKPLFVRWTTDWDCGKDTGWWYIIKDAPFDMGTLSSNSRKHIKEAFRKVNVEKIDPVTFIDALYECSHQAFLAYKLASNEMSYEKFKETCLDAKKNGLDYWASFDKGSRKLIGFLICQQHQDWAEIYTAKFYPQFLKLRASDALYASVLDYYLNQKLLRYVSSGSRSISHVTNTQEYKEQHFGYRKAFCKLNIEYSSVCKSIVLCLYPLRNVISLFGRFNKKIHLFSSVLKMEEICRKGKSV